MLIILSAGFDGDGMLHAIRIKDGKASYANRFVKTSRLLQERAAGIPLFLKACPEPASPDLRRHAPSYCKWCAYQAYVGGGGGVGGSHCLRRRIGGRVCVGEGRESGVCGCVCEQTREEENT